MTPRASTRPITRTPAARRPTDTRPPGVLRLLATLKPFAHQLKPRAAEVLAGVEWQDLWAERDERFLASAVKARLGLAETARFLVDRFDPDSRVGPPPTAAQPADRPKAAPAALRALSSPPVGVETI